MQQRTTLPATLNFATFLAPVLFQTYETIARYVGEQLGCSTCLHTGQSCEEFADEATDIGFLCGLQYVHLQKHPVCPVELLVAPVLLGQRYQHRPIYYSDVVVHAESMYTSFEDLQGCIWAYNERASHSGYTLVCAHLLEHDKSLHYFGETRATGSHLQSLQAVLDGTAHACAIDSHVLDVLVQEQPEIGTKIRSIERLGPSTIPPLVIAHRLDRNLKDRIRAVLLSMHEVPSAARALQKGRIERFVMIEDESYNDIRAMFALVGNLSTRKNLPWNEEKRGKEIFQTHIEGK
jgi:phosphonate transport system substrate-binding protein